MAGTDIVTVDEVKAHLNIRPADTSQDAELAVFIASVTDVVEHIVGPVVPREVVEVHDCAASAVVLRQPPALSVTAVDQAGTTMAAADYRLSAAGIVYRTAGAWRGLVTVTYLAGRTVVPASIKMAAMELVAVNFRPQQGGNFSPFDSAGVGDTLAGEVRLGFFVPNRVIQLLAPHQQFAGIA